MRLFKFRGGVHPDGHKQATACKSIEILPIPEFLYVPVQQHVGAPAAPEVSVGDRVLKGQLLAHSQGAVSAPVHAPTSGVVYAIENHPAPHPSGLPVKTIVIQSDGEDSWAKTVAPIDPFQLSADEIAMRVGAAGVVGMGGATFPSAVKLNLRDRYTIHTLVINGAECEPYLTCDDRLMRERSEQIIDGIRIIQKALGANKVIVVIEDNKNIALASMKTAAADFPDIAMAKVPTRYPMGSEKHMIQAVTGKEVPARSLSADIGMIVHNVGTAYAVHRAVRYGRPLVSRVVTVSGDAIDEPRNIEVLLGTRVSALIDYCGGYKEAPSRILMGGPMMGQTLPHEDVPIVKGTGGIVALTSQQVTEQLSRPCIRCASCVSACPCGLLPLELATRSKKGDFDGALDYGLMDCVACGSCAYVCPSNIPLVQYFNYAKGKLAAKHRDQQKTAETKKLAEQRIARLEREKAAKAKAAAERKAKKAAQKAAAAAAKAKQGDIASGASNSSKKSVEEGANA
ncbi:MAG: electron transport complex subunit RsxC [Gammaproteobacteria bacterium]|jgi:electron transport complex protein RnfC